MQRLRYLAARHRVSAALKRHTPASPPWELTASYNTAMSSLRSELKEYPHDIILRMDAYQRDHNRWLPALAMVLPFPSLFQATSPDKRASELLSDMEERMAWLETVTPLIDDIVDEYGVPTSEGYAEAVINIPRILQRTAEFLHDREEGDNTTTEQYCALIAASFLLAQSGTDKMYQPAMSSHHLQKSATGWLTQQLISRPAEVHKVIAEYHDRALRRAAIRLKLHRTTIYEQMVSYSDDLIDRIADVQKRDSHLFTRLEYSFFDCAAPEGMVSEAIYFAPILSTEGYSVTAFSFISGLHMYKELPHYDDFALAPEPVREQCEALLRVCLAMYMHVFAGIPIRDRAPQGRHIGDKRLVQYLLDHPERSERVVAAIKERDTTDAETLIAATSHVMAEGFL